MKTKTFLKYAALQLNECFFLWLRKCNFWNKTRYSKNIIRLAFIRFSKYLEFLPLRCHPQGMNEEINLFYFHFKNVAETLVNPMGEDDDDFDISAIIDSN